MNSLDTKINDVFPGCVVRKDLVKEVKGNAIVPSYVLEYLLGQYCATNDEATINAGIESVKEILAKHYVHRNEAELIKSYIKEKGRYKVIDKIFAELDEKNDCYRLTFSNLGINRVLVDAETVSKKLEGNGRILLRPSGTENLVRVMVEAETDEICKDMAELVVEKLKKYAV